MEVVKVGDVVIPTFDLSGKVAVITGGTKGIGYGISLTMAHYGADVVVASRTAADCERVAAEIHELTGRRAIGVATNVTDVKSCDALIEKAVAEMGKVDIMICNAGVSGTVFATEMSEDEWDRVVDGDLKSVFFTARAAAKQMIAQGTGGRIICTSSSAAFSANKGIAHYCAAKAGVVNMIKSLACEWGKYGITVNAICPGYVPTNINAEALANPKVRAGIEQRTFVKRLGKVEEITPFVLVLASDYSGYTTGASILINGGT